MQSAIHFVGFSGDEFIQAVKIFGSPDFVHRYWDSRAKSMITDEDIVVFAKGNITDIPNRYNFDDSEVM